MGRQIELRQGTLDMLILKAVSLGRARFHSLTAAGRRGLKPETEGWNRMASLVAGILNPTSEES